MKIIITENQQESIKIELQSMVKDIGWELTAKIVNGPKKLAKLAFNNGPMEFLNLFNDLDVVQSKKNPDCTLFKYKKGNNVMVLLGGNVNIDYNKIWSFLGEGFGLDFYETKKLTELWLYDAYNLEGTRTNYYDYYDFIPL
jgi:hypothetical protein